jgi:FkbM family methyltransferase
VSRNLSKRVGIQLRRVFRRTFVIGIARKLRELIVRPYVHRLLAQATRRFGTAFTVVQVGANDGVMDDPLSGLIFQHRWSGVLVEPNPRNFAKLRQTYREHPQVRLEESAITERPGSVTLYRPIEMPDGEPNPFRGLDSMCPSHFETLSWIDKDWQRYVEQVQVPSMTLASLFEKHSLREVHFFLTDTEGYDKIILDQLDNSGVRPPFLQFEYIHMPGPELAELKSRLRSQGYRLLGLRWDIFAYQPGWADQPAADRSPSVAP